MNQRTVKRLRKIVFGSGSRHQVGYKIERHKENALTLHCAGLRAVFKALKKSHRKERQNG